MSLTSGLPRVVMLAIALLMPVHAHLAVAADPATSAEPIPVVAGKLHNGQIHGGSTAFLSQNAVADVRLPHHARHVFTADAPGELSISAHSDTRRLVLAVLQNGQLLKTAQPHPSRLATQQLSVTVSAGDRLEIMVGGDASQTPVPYSLWVIDSHAPALVPPLPRAVRVDVKKSAGQGLNPATPFQSQPAHWFSVPAAKDSKDWYTIRASSKDFDPMLVMLDDKNQVITWQDDVSRQDRSAVFTFRASQAPEHFVLIPAEELGAKDPTSLKYDLDVSRRPYDPNRPFIAGIEYYLGSTLGAFILGVVASALISYYFYVRSIRTKELHWEVISDEIFVDSSSTAQSLNITVNGVEVQEASRLRVRFVAKGPHQIASNLVATPLKLQLKNALAILAMSERRSESSGWRALPVPNEASIRLDFDRLNPKDSIELDIIYSQTGDQLPEVAGAVLHGAIAEVAIHKDHDRPATVVTRIATLALNLIALLLLPLLLLDSVFRFMPGWWAQLWIYYMPWLLLIVMFYSFATAEGRSSLMKMLRYLASVSLFWRRRT